MWPVGHSSEISTLAMATARVCSLVGACSNVAMAPTICKNIRPIAAGVSALPRQPTSRGSSALLVHSCSESS
jgi:hypothetical protein